MKWGIDLDGVVFDFVTPFIERINKKYNMSIKRSDITAFNWHECVNGLTDEQFQESFEEFSNESGFRDLPLIEGAYEAINRISKAGHDIWFITSRPPCSSYDTHEALDKHNICYNLIFDKNKHEHVANLDIDIFIDDALHNISKIVEHTNCKTYLIDTLYNKTEGKHTFIRANSLLDVVKKEGL